MPRIDALPLNLGRASWVPAKTKQTVVDENQLLLSQHRAADSVHVSLLRIADELNYSKGRLRFEALPLTVRFSIRWCHGCQQLARAADGEEGKEEKPICSHHYRYFSFSVF